MMKAINKTAIVTVATLFALTAGIAQANPFGYGYKVGKVDYSNSFNTDNKAKINIDNSKRFNRNFMLDYRVDNSSRTKVNTDYRIKQSKDIRKNKINANQSLNQYRNYYSGVSQGANNYGSATGHSMKQKQGGTSVGSLVDQTNRTQHKGHSFLSPSVHTNSGDQATGNMTHSQIGGIQSGMQLGDVTNLQTNSQKQNASSGVSSSDSVSNTASK
ncbi:hypothetical protein [Motiliproteus sp.]|uniref:hypothetical protein n=1 Tax=Motiliproteus sp. TaxID=1898955 RepID=UPI003BAC6FBC